MRILSLGLLLILGLTSPALVSAAEVVSLSRGYINSWAVIDAGGVVIVDAGQPGDARGILRRIEKLELTDRVTAIVLTHAHTDHAGGARELSEVLGVPVILGEGDVPMAAAGFNGELTHTGAKGARLLSWLLPQRFPPLKPNLTVQDQLSLRDFGVDGRVRVVRGHTEGSTVVELASGEVLIGDLIRGGLFRRSVPRLHFFHVELGRAHFGLRGLIEEGASALYPGHGSALDPEAVKKWLEDWELDYLSPR